MSEILNGKVALVTGGSSGIGKAVARRFAAEGAQVFVTGRRQSELDATVAELGTGVTAVRADVSDPNDLDGLFAQIRDTHRALDVVVANAGVGVGAGVESGLGAITEDQYERVFGINVKGVVFTVQKALPLLAEPASVILMGSTTSISPGPGMSLYAASKAAVRNLARSWILDLAGRDIRVNVLSPGPTDTPGLAGLAAAGQEQALLASLAAVVPLGRIGRPDEIAQAALFLASDASSFVNGAELFADGGQAQV